MTNFKELIKIILNYEQVAAIKLLIQKLSSALRRAFYLFVAFSITK